MRQSCNSLKCNKKFKLLAPHENTLKTIQRNLHYTAWKWFNGDRFKLIRVNLQKDFRSICGNIQYFAKWRKFQKIQENLSKIKNSLRSVFIAAWPELVQFNCGNFLVCLCLFFTNKEKNKISFCLFLCLWKRARQTLVSRPKYWLWLAGAALGYSMEMREFFQKTLR